MLTWHHAIVDAEVAADHVRLLSSGILGEFDRFVHRAARAVFTIVDTDDAAVSSRRSERRELRLRPAAAFADACTSALACGHEHWRVRIVDIQLDPDRASTRQVQCVRITHSSDTCSRTL